jgi:hypothetical protein
MGFLLQLSLGDIPTFPIQNLIHLTGYMGGGGKVDLIKSPHPCFHRVLPLAMQAPLVNLEPLTDRVAFKL